MVRHLPQHRVEDLLHHVHRPFIRPAPVRRTSLRTVPRRQRAHRVVQPQLGPLHQPLADRPQRQRQPAAPPDQFGGGRSVALRHRPAPDDPDRLPLVQRVDDQLHRAVHPQRGQHGAARRHQQPVPGGQRPDLRRLPHVVDHHQHPLARGDRTEQIRATPEPGRLMPVRHPEGVQPVPEHPRHIHGTVPPRVGEIHVHLPIGEEGAQVAPHTVRDQLRLPDPAQPRHHHRPHPLPHSRLGQLPQGPPLLGPVHEPRQRRRQLTRRPHLRRSLDMQRVDPLRLHHGPEHGPTRHAVPHPGTHPRVVPVHHRTPPRRPVCRCGSP